MNTYKIHYYDYDMADHTLHLRARSHEQAIERLNKRYAAWGVWSCEKIEKKQLAPVYVPQDETQEETQSESQEHNIMEFDNSNIVTETIIPTADQGVFNHGEKVVLRYKRFVLHTPDSSEWIEKKAVGTIVKIEKSIFYPENYGQSIVTIKWDGQEKETVQFACALFKKQ